MKRFIALAAFSVLSITAQAGLISVDFDSGPGASVATYNYTEKGFTFSPNCHFDIWTRNESAFMGFDGGGGCPGTHNSSFRGPDQYNLENYAGGEVIPVLYVDRGGQLFDLISLNKAAPSWIVYSSKGGSYDARYPENEVVTFSGPEWQQLEWVLFAARGVGMPVGFDDFVADVPEPGSISLVGLGLSFVAVGRWRRARRLSKPN